MWPQVVVKELIDNALDVAEQAETAPRIEVTITESMIEVRDNGPGIPGAVIEDILDFTVRVSSREAYVGPTRGAQGNALKTIMVMPFVLDGNAGMVEVESLGVHYKILFAIDRIAQEPKAEIVREHLSCKKRDDRAPALARFSLLNPEQRPAPNLQSSLPVRRVQPAPAPDQPGGRRRESVGANQHRLEAVAPVRSGPGALV